MIKRTSWLVLCLAAGLSGCIGPAIVDAARHWDDYKLLDQRQLDADHFVAIVSIAHDRGEFDVLGGHGSHVVVRSVDVVLLGLAVTPGGLNATRLDTRTFESEKELDDWRELVADFDGTNRRLRFTHVHDPVDARRSSDVDFNAVSKTIRSRVHGRACAVPMPPRLGPGQDAPMGTLSDDRGHALVQEWTPDGQKAVLLDLCDAAAPRHALAYPNRSTVGIAVAADGSPGVVRITHDSARARYGEWLYEARLYPGPEILSFDAGELGLGKDTILMPYEFMVDAPARRFHWIIVPPLHSDRLLFFTHDFSSGATTRHEAPFPGS